MSYDINVLCVNQTEPVYIPFKSTIILQNEVDNTDSMGVSRYWNIWPYFSKTSGIQYELTMKWLNGYGAYPICDSDYSVSASETLIPRWLAQDSRNDLTPLIIKKSIYKNFMEIVKYLLEASPDKTILFHTRYQSQEKEIVLGVIRFSEFVEMLNKKEIMFNVCYIIAADEAIEI